MLNLIITVIIAPIKIASAWNKLQTNNWHFRNYVAQIHWRLTRTATLYIFFISQVTLSTIFLVLTLQSFLKCISCGRPVTGFQNCSAKHSKIIQEDGEKEFKQLWVIVRT